ncbi:MAG: hypothetical protein WCJ80_14405 [Bacteroidota bacterium]
MNLKKATLIAKYSLNSSERNLILSLLYLVNNISIKLSENGKLKLINNLDKIDATTSENMLYR